MAAEKLPTASEAIDTAKNVIPNIRDKAALALRTEEGPVKPGVQTALQVGSGLVGAAPGIIHGNVPAAVAGGAAAYKLAPRIAEGLIPNLPDDIPTKTPIGATLPSVDEFYANRAEDLAKRGKEQATIDKAAEREQTAQEKATAKEGKAVPITQGPYYNQHLEALKAQEEATKAQTEAAKPKLVSPTEGEPRVTGSEGRPATWTNEFVQEQAGKGNRDAISQAVRRGLELPTNARYVMGDPDFPRAVLNPREVTLFTPEGIPIRNKANAQAEASQGTIPTISRTPRGRIPTIGEQTPATVPETAPLAAKPTAEAIPEPVAATGEAKPAETPNIERSPSETNAIRAELSEYNQKAKKWGDKIASARPSSWKAQRDWMDNLEAADKRVGQLKEALEKGTPIKLGRRGATKEELTVSYRNLSPEDKAQVDDLASTFSNMKDAYAKKYFSDQYQLNDSRFKGLPTKEKLARFVTRSADESPAMKFIKSLNENPDAEPVEPTEAAKPTGIQNIGATPSSAFKIPSRHQMIAETPATIKPVLDETGWQYEGKNTMGLHTITEPGTNIKLELWDRELNPDFIRRKIAEKEKQFGVPKKSPKAKEGEEKVPF